MQNDGVEADPWMFGGRGERRATTWVREVRMGVSVSGWVGVRHRDDERIAAQRIAGIHG